MKKMLIIAVVILGLVVLSVIYFQRNNINKTLYPVNLVLEDVWSDPQVLKLVKAATAGHKGKVGDLVKRGVDVNYPGKFKITPLWWVVPSNKPNSVSILLDIGANPNAVIEGGMGSIVTFAAAVSDPRILKLILEKGGNTEMVGIEQNGEVGKRTPIFTTIRYDRTENLKTLIAAGADINHKDGQGVTPAMSAALVDDFEKVLLLLEAGAEINITDNFDRNLKSIIEESRFQDEESEKVLKFIESKTI